MKLLRFGEPGKEKPGLLLPSGEAKDLSKYFDDWDRDFFITDGMKFLAELLAEKGKSFPNLADSTRIGPCIARPGKVMAIGLNYSGHAQETVAKIPDEPIVFLKAPNSICGAYDAIRIPKNSLKTDWEVELGVVIGKDARYLDSPAESMDYVAGYCISHDVSERSFQKDRGGGQWTKGKSCDTFNPIGPYLVSCDEIKDPQNLTLGTKVNGQMMQESHTSAMIFNVAFLIYHLSQFMTLEAGDLLSTGTPEGVGMGHVPPVYLKEGDQINMWIEGLGEQKNRCIAWDAKA